MDYNQAYAYVSVLAGPPETTVMDWRALSDFDKSLDGHARRGTLPEYWEWLCSMNAAGYGIFACFNAMDGAGRELANVHHIRAHVVDLDNASASQNYQRIIAANPPPTFAVQSSPGKFHTYHVVEPYTGNDYFTVLQRKLRQLYDGDKSVVDATRILRVPGSYNHKYSHPLSPKRIEGAQPVMVQCWAVSGQRYPVQVLEAALNHVNVIDGGAGVRKELGDPELAAPSLEWLKRALAFTDPNTLDRFEWVALTAAIKQAGWSLTDPQSLFDIWSQWCAQYADNDPAENLKQWNSIRNTELGWHSLVRRVPSLSAYGMFEGKDRSAEAAILANGAPQAAANFSGTVPQLPVSEPPPLDCSGEILSHLECKEWFKGCTYVSNLGLILTPDGRFLNQSKFNADWGGKIFIINGQGKTTDEAWKAATRSTLYRIPKVDHIRFLPHEPCGAVIPDELGRKGINTYIPLQIRRVKGNIAPFLNHITALLPDPRDQKILLDFLAHNVKFPGFKIPWAPVVQSAEGAGKGVIKAVMKHGIGRPYIYYPNAQELAESGSKFNAWMRNKLFILVDEVKTDEKRELIEVLKPLISEEETEVQSKGVDQDLEDNFANWCFFTNWKDAVPINKNSRRFSIMYSPLQTEADLNARGMDGAYFNALYAWLKADGAAVVTDYLMDYPIERGSIPMRAPETSSAAEAIRISRSPLERVILEAIEDGLPGFRGGWISSLAVMARVRTTGAMRGAPSPQVIGQVVTGMGFVSCGRADRPYFQEDRETRTELWHWGQVAPVANYGPAQGWS